MKKYYEPKIVIELFNDKSYNLLTESTPDFIPNPFGDLEDEEGLL